MGTITADIIEPREIVRSFGRQRVAVTDAVVGEGGLSDSRFMDFTNAGPGRLKWVQAPIDEVKASYLKLLRHHAQRRGSNGIIFHGWPEISVRDDGAVAVYSRVCFVKMKSGPMQG